MLKSALASICILFSLQSLTAQVNPVDTFQTFTYQEGDSTYVMKQYFLCLLKIGPNRDQDQATSEKIQTEHLAHLEKLAGDGKICMVGPMGDKGDLLGIAIYNVTTQKEAEKLAKADPAVKAGRLLVEIHPWWAAVGSKLF